MEYIFGRPRRSTRLRCCGCLLILFLLLILCVLLALLAFVRPRSAHAQGDSTRCTTSDGASTFQLAPGLPEPQPASAARGVFFQRETVITLTGQARVCLASTQDGQGDLRVDDQIELSVIHTDSLTRTWQHDFGNAPVGGIAALPPQDVSTLFATGAHRVRLALRDTRPPVYSARPVWLIIAPLPAPPATLTPPVIEPTSSLAIVALVRASTPPAPTDVPTDSPTAIPEPSEIAAPATRAWPMSRWIVAGGAVSAGALICIILWRTRQRRRVRQQPVVLNRTVVPERTVGDDGTLEICDTQTGSVQRVELREMGLGEVWTIGDAPTCRIRVGPDLGEREYATLVLTPDGPLLKSRGQPLWFDDKPVTEHLLFDGDDVIAGRWVLWYQNFFRRRELYPRDEPEEVNDMLQQA